MGRRRATKRFSHTIKARVLRITTVFSLLVAVILATLSVAFFHAFARRNVIQSTEFNLQLVAGLVGQDFSALESLCSRCALSQQVASWLKSDAPSGKMQLGTYYFLQDEYNSSRARPYIRRLLLTDKSNSKILQITTAGGKLVTPFNVRELLEKGSGVQQGWQKMQLDPLDPNAGELFVTVQPIQEGSRVLGYLYLSVLPSLLTDRLKDYAISSDSPFYVRLSQDVLQVKRGYLQRTPRSAGKWSPLKEQTMAPKSQVGRFTDSQGHKTDMVLYPVEAVQNMYLVNGLSLQMLHEQLWLYARLLLFVCGAVVLLGLIIGAVLDRLINPPIAQLRAHMEQISKGDFSVAPEIEWDNEFGDIGRGVNSLSQNVDRLMRARLADEKKKKDLEYRMLQSQINPHFLYNTLNSIKWMATIQGSTGIAEMTTALARLLKRISKGTQQLLPLQEEIALLDDYFVIQRYRYGGAITLEKDLAPDVLDTAIPRFTLQPLLENAIFHGIEPKGGAGTVRLRARRQDSGDVEIRLTDNGVGMSPLQVRQMLSGDTREQGGMFSQLGLRNVQQRLLHAFGQPYGLSIESKEGAYTTMVILLPGASAQENIQEEDNNEDETTSCGR